ncbi:hypothetical protein GCM10022420_093360 [Streptomyces iranensis]
MFRDGALRPADHHAAGGNATYVYQFGYHPAEDPGHLGATRCWETPRTPSGHGTTEATARIRHFG